MLQSPFILGLLGNTAMALGIISLVFLVNIIRRRTMKHMDNLIAYTVGLLIAIVFFGFIPEIIEESHLDIHTLSYFFVSGILLFYIFELFLHWHHCKDLGEDSGHHHHDHHTHEHGNNTLMFTGTFIHNIIHGIILFSAFSIDIHFGLATTLAVFLHAIPQNIANLLMNHKDVRFAYIAAFGGVFGAIITYPFREFLISHNFEILSIIAGGLLYTAMSDILPSFKGKGTLTHKFMYLIMMILGITSYIGFSHFIHEEHSHGDDQLEALEDHDTHPHDEEL